jgi:membrane-associated phospholipid phosphatase
MTGNITSRMCPFDWLIVGYCSLMMMLIVVFGRPLGNYLDELAVYAGISLISLLIVRYVDEDRGRLHAFARLLYPVLLFGLFYRTMGGLVFLFFDGFLDWQLTTFERLIIGVNPTLYIDQHLLNVWLNELFSFCYFSYYFMVPVLLLLLFRVRKYDAMKQSLTAICVAFFMSYVLFTLYPIEGPRWFFVNEFANTIDGPVFRPLTQMVIDNAAFHGGCMPSSHVAVALVVMLAGFKHLRKLGWVLVPVNIGLAIGTVWGRYHYISDMFVGAAIGIFATVLVWKYFDKWNKVPYKAQGKKELVAERVS